MLRHATPPTHAMIAAPMVLRHAITYILILVSSVLQDRDMRGVISQRERNDCAPAAATMLLNASGYDVSYERIRSMFALSDNGASVRALTDVLTSFDSLVRAWKLDPSDTQALRPPAILLLDRSHYVVLDSMRRGWYYFRDPTRGRLAKTTHQLLAEWNGVVIQANPKDATP